MRDPTTRRVFVSYSRKDGLEFARRLQALLEAEGVSLYRDFSDLEGGKDWWRQVEAALRTVEHVAYCRSTFQAVFAYHQPHESRWTTTREIP